MSGDPLLGWTFPRVDQADASGVEVSGVAGGQPCIPGRTNRGDLRVGRDDGSGFDEFIAIIHPDNVRSQRVAEKLGMAIEQQVLNPVLGRPVDVWQTETPSLGGGATARGRSPR